MNKFDPPLVVLNANVVQIDCVNHNIHLASEQHLTEPHVRKIVEYLIGEGFISEGNWNAMCYCH